MLKSMESKHRQTVENLIALSRALGEFGEIKRATLLPHGEHESDSHHSFVLALIAYELAMEYAPELDAPKVLLYALVHDLPELETGDTNTLLTSSAELKTKALTDSAALRQARKRFKHQPHVLCMIEAYEAKADAESLFVYWIDKLMTILTHFFDDGKNLRELGIQDQRDIQQWYDRLLEKLHRHGPGHHVASTVLETAFRKMHDELLEPPHAQ